MVVSRVSCLSVSRRYVRQEATIHSQLVLELMGETWSDTKTNVVVVVVVVYYELHVFGVSLLFCIIFIYACFPIYPGYICCHLYDNGMPSFAATAKTSVPIRRCVLQFANSRNGAAMKLLHFEFQFVGGASAKRKGKTDGKREKNGRNESHLGKWECVCRFVD